MKRRLTAILLVTVLICMVSVSTMSCSPSTPQAYCFLTMVPTYGGRVAYGQRDPIFSVLITNIPEGQVVDIVAVPDEGFRFVNWTRDVDTVADVTDATTTITMTGNYTIVANFVKEIHDWHDLNAIRDNLRARHVLMNDLDSTTAGYEELAGVAANDGKGWQPIGTPDDPFQGSFDGQGYEIRHLFVNRPDESEIGLFGRVNRGLIDSVGLVNADVTGDRDVGGLLGGNYEGTVSNSYSTGNVTGNNRVGGLVGFAWCLSTVSKSYSACTVTGSRGVGGLVGVNWAGTVDDSYSAGNVTGTSLVGGLAGANFIAGGTVNNSYSTGSVLGDDEVGGLLGHNSNTVTASHSTGKVTGNSRVGGLVGDDAGGTVSSSFWDTETSGQAASAGGTGKTTAEMMDIATYTDTDTEGLDEPWDIVLIGSYTNQTWYIDNGNDYPRLGWQHH